VASSSDVEAVNSGETEQAPRNPDDPKCPPSIIEGPDPIGAASDCDKDKDSRDKRENSNPQVGHDRVSGNPFIVWTVENAGDHDVAYREWIDDDWGRTEFLTATLEDERDPAIWAAADGSIHVAWWSPGAGVEISRRDRQTGIWSLARSISADGARPAITRVDDAAIVAYERVARDGGQQIVVATESAAGGFDERVVAVVAATRAARLQFHQADGRLWLDWKQGDGRLAFSERLVSGWSPVRTTEIAESTWEGEQQARVDARRELLSD
jgi:hypothetical protein